MIKKVKDTLVLFIFTFAAAILSITLYIKYLWPSSDYEQIRGTIKDLSLDVIVQNTYLKDVFFAFLFFVIVWPIMSMKAKTKTQFITAILMIVAVIFLSGYPKYAYYSKKTSTLYEEEYANPNNIKFEFPTQKRNLILIFVESLEQNYTSKQNYGQNLIPNLSSLQTQTNYNKNYNSLTGTHYSIAALVSDLCGIPLRLDPSMDIEQSRYFLPQAVCFPEILQQNGYQTKIIKAADIEYTHADIFAKTHGYDSALGTNELKTKYNELNQEIYQGTFGGINDRALFTYALKELDTFNHSKPFMLTLFTLDTHTPRYFEDPKCPKQFNDLRDAIVCTDSIINEFLEKIKTKPYYQNTTIVIVGDHLLPSRIKSIGSPKRQIFNVFLNLDPKLKINNNKLFSSLDIAPTILESMNIKMSPRAFGLGRSLFSNAPTLLEKYKNSLKTIIVQQSAMYKKFQKPLVSHKHVYVPYKLNTVLDNQKSTLYTEFFENLLDINYLDCMNFLLEKKPQSDLIVDLKFNAITDNKPVIIKANNTEVLKFQPQKNAIPPFSVKFSINKDLITDNKLQLTFRNTKGILTAIQMGIAPLNLVISEK